MGDDALSKQLLRAVVGRLKVMHPFAIAHSARSNGTTKRMTQKVVSEEDHSAYIHELHRFQKVAIIVMRLELL